jgi:hypothetical protein
MGTAIAVRTDFSSQKLRRLATRVKNAAQARTARSAIASRRRLQRPSPQVEDRKPELLVQTDSFGDLTGH